MILKFYTAAFISLTALLSCGGSSTNNDYEDKSLMSPAAENKTIQTADTIPASAQTINTQPNATIGTAVTPGAKTVNISPDINPVKTNPQVITAPQVVTTPQVANGKLNPAHGQPGHRCDISVGAPLDSKPTQTITQPAANINTTPAVNTQPTAQTTAPGMNPPHGQPGHRCDITVGAPLNSKPTQPVIQVPTTVPPVTVNPVKPDSTKKQ